VASLYRTSPKEPLRLISADELIGMEPTAALSRVGKFSSKEKKETILALLAKYVQLQSITMRDFATIQLEANCERALDSILTSLEEEDVADTLDIAMGNFSLVAGHRIMEMISLVSSVQPVRKMLKEKGRLGFVVTTFANSYSFDSASSYSDIILSLAPLLNKAQIETALNAMSSNDQIRYSWGAQRKLQPFMDWAEGKVDHSILKHTRENFAG
jgi:hypothetical protein